MDFLLDVADDLFLDTIWSKLVPLSAFPRVKVQNGSSIALPIIAGSVSKYDQFISYLPHPALVMDDISTIYSTVPQISAWPRTYIPRQLISLYFCTLISISLLYFFTAWFSYTYIFNHDMMRHPKWIPGQVRLEIKTSFKAFPLMTLLTMPWFEAEVLGYSKMYNGLDTYGYWYLFASVPLFLLFTDYCIYWAHRGLHIPWIYKPLHKLHHKWIIPSPFSSHAFHPVDGYIQSLPYHIFVFLFPLHRMVYISLFIFVNFWSILIHDSDMISDHPLEKIINGPAHHTLHHIYFTVNYGQYFTWADRVGNSYRQPMQSLDPLLDVKKADKLKSHKSM